MATLNRWIAYGLLTFALVLAFIGIFFGFFGGISDGLLVGLNEGGNQAFRGTVPRRQRPAVFKSERSRSFRSQVIWLDRNAVRGYQAGLAEPS